MHILWGAGSQQEPTYKTLYVEKLGRSTITLPG